MSELKPRITENGIDYILVGDYYIPDLKLSEEELQNLFETGTYNKSQSSDSRKGMGIGLYAFPLNSYWQSY